jgi:autotransporter-associated beta strand protein
LTIIDSDVGTSSSTAGAAGGSGASAGSAAGAGLFLMAGVNATIDNSGNLFYSDQISGDGGFSKIGAGTFFLSGTHNYLGPTNVNVGRLNLDGSITSDVAIGVGGELGGIGQVFGNVTNNGRLAAGNSIGTFTVTGNYTQNAGSTMEVEIAPGGNTPGTHNDLVSVTGTATINGGTLDVVASAGSYTAGTLYTFLQSAAGASGAFDNVTDNLSNFNVVVVFGAHDIQFQLVPATTLFGFATTPNQQAVATYGGRGTGRQRRFGGRVRRGKRPFRRKRALGPGPDQRPTARHDAANRLAGNHALRVVIGQSSAADPGRVAGR